MIYHGGKTFERGLDAGEDEVRETLTQYGLLPGEYMLFVGTISPRKNVEVIVRGYERYRTNGGTARLVLAGGFGAKSDNIRAQIVGSPFSKDIVLTGYVTEKNEAHLVLPRAYAVVSITLGGVWVSAPGGDARGDPHHHQQHLLHAGDSPRRGRLPV